MTKAQVARKVHLEIVDHLLDTDTRALTPAALDEWTSIMAYHITRSERLRNLIDVEWLLIQYVPVYLASWVVLVIVLLDDGDLPLVLVLSSCLAVGTVLLGWLVRDYIRRRKGLGLWSTGR